MSNLLSQKEINEIKNKMVYVVSFYEDGKRHFTQGTNYKKAIELMQDLQKKNLKCLILSKHQENVAIRTLNNKTDFYVNYMDIIRNEV